MAIYLLVILAIGPGPGAEPHISIISAPGLEQCRQMAVIFAKIKVDGSENVSRYSWCVQGAAPIPAEQQMTGVG